MALPNRSILRLARLLGLALMVGLSGAAMAQAQTWVALTAGAPAGTPAELVLLPGSGTQVSILELRLHGYFRQNLTGPNGVTYARLDFPGLGRIDQVGAPELPAARPYLALPSFASGAFLSGLSVAPSDLITLNAKVYPQPVPALDGDPGAGDPDGTPEQFSVNGAIYAGNQTFPAAQASGSALPQTLLSGARGVQLELFPVRFTPNPDQVVIARRTQYTYQHTGSASNTPLTRDHRRLLASQALNFSAVAAFFPETTFQGRYLVISPAAFTTALQPWIEYRQACGFVVTHLTLESLSSVTSASLRAAIANWSSSLPTLAEKYCLLVGDADVLPTAQAPIAGAPPSDDPYGSPSGSAGLTESIYVGRWPVDDAAQLSELIARTQAYELDQNSAHDYGRISLVAHNSEAPGGFVAEQEAIRLASYSAPLTFSSIYGNQPGAGDGSLNADLALGPGLIAYRGHGTANSWINWAAVGGDLGTWHKEDLASLPLPFAPVVWSLSCSNGAVDLGDSLGEAWLTSSNGSVAHYGSSRESAKTANRRLNQQLFELAFQDGIRTQGQLIALAEAQTSAWYPNSPNAWLYSLMGCPAMKLRGAPPKPLDLVLPATVPLCSGVCPVVVSVLGPGSVPQQNVLISAHKAAFDPALPDEIQSSASSGTSGTTTIPLGPQTLGTINTTGRDDDGNVALEGIAAKSGAFTKLGNGTPGTQGTPRLASNSNLTPGLQASLRVEDGRPFSPALLAGSLSSSPLPLYGGTLYPSLPFAAELVAPLNAVGDHVFLIQPWPPNFPGGLHVYFQAGIVDAEALPGVALTNALDGLTP